MNKNLINKLIQLKNSSILLNGKVNTVYLRSLVSILFFLYREGVLQSYEIKVHKITHFSQLTIYFRQYLFQSNLNELKILTTKSSQLSLTYKDFLKISTREKILAISTTKGLLTLLECKKQKLGGILLFSC